MMTQRRCRSIFLKQQFGRHSSAQTQNGNKKADMFQSLLSQLEIHGAGVSTEDANQKFPRSLPSTCSQVSLIIRTKPGVDSLSFNDLYNNLRVFESDVKGSTASSLAKAHIISKGNQDIRRENTGTTGNMDKRKNGEETCEETHESMPEPVVNEPKVVSEPKVWSAAPIIEEYESDSEDEHVSTYERTGNT
ncbi:hypothetical protein Tco_0282991 [Tanacetum coccineum]